MRPLAACDRRTVDMLSADEFLERVTRTIADQLSPRRIVLFGSRARGDAHAESDYDIMVELETDLPTNEMEQLYDLLPDEEGTIELFVYTPEELRRWQDDVGTLVYDIVREGRLLYSRPGVTTADLEPVASSATRRVREGTDSTSTSLRAWIDLAQGDFAMMEAASKLDPVQLGGVCFHAHQCCEKLLKACLIARSIRPPRTHSLPQLLGACQRAGIDLRRLRGRCRRLQRLYPRSRYPHEQKPTKSDAAFAIAAVTTIRNAALAALGGVEAE